MTTGFSRESMTTKRPRSWWTTTIQCSQLSTQVMTGWPDDSERTIALRALTSSSLRTRGMSHL